VKCTGCGRSTGQLTTLQSWRPPSWPGAHAMITITASTEPVLLTRRIVRPIHSWPVACHSSTRDVRFRVISHKRCFCDGVNMFVERK
jgi:hypothetical protein